jgi:hypothetical protein
MVLLNASKRARYASSIMNQNQGGGDKKSGFPYQIGRDSWSSIFLHSVDPINGRCCGLSGMNMTMYYTKNIVRPAWVRPGAAYGFGSFP